jgi:TolB protein
MRINLTRSRGGERAFAWSPDGRQIAFTSDREDRFDLYVMDAAGRSGSNLTRGTVPRLNALWPPFWSPDGGHIAFVSTLEAYAYKLHVMRSDGSGLRAISPNPVDGLGLPPAWAWSPDGRQLAFVSSPSNRIHEFYVADVGSETLESLNLEAFDIYALSWSPDARLPRDRSSQWQFRDFRSTSWWQRASPTH